MGWMTSWSTSQPISLFMPLIFGGRVWLNCGIHQMLEQLLFLPLLTWWEDPAGLCVKQAALKEDGTTVPVLCKSHLGSSEMGIKSARNGWAFPKLYPSVHWKIPLLPSTASLHFFAEHWVPGQCQQHTQILVLPREIGGMQVPCMLLCVPLSCISHRRAGSLALSMAILCFPWTHWTIY